MSKPLVSSGSVQLCYSFQLGPIIREAGKSRPTTLHAIARDHGPAAVDQIMESPGQWIQANALETPASCAEAPRREEKVQGAPAAPSTAPQLLPDIHPGTPATARVELNAKVLKQTTRATLISLPDKPRAQTWVPNAHVLRGGTTEPYGCERLLVPVWLYRRIREQLPGRKPSP
jgi:hypothetical protein